MLHVWSETALNVNVTDCPFVYVFEEKSERFMPGSPVVTWLLRITAVPANCVVPSVIAPSTISVLLVPSPARLHETNARHGQPDEGAVVAQAMTVCVTPPVMALMGAPRLHVTGALRTAVPVPQTSPATVNSPPVVV
jgi:hypothetical protein